MRRKKLRVLSQKNGHQPSLFKLTISSTLNAFLWSTFLDLPQTQFFYKIYRAILRHIFISNTLKAWFAHVHRNVYAQFFGAGGAGRSARFKV